LHPTATWRGPSGPASTPPGRRGPRGDGLALAACLAAIAIGCPRSQADAATYFVDRSSASCTNAGAGTETQPYCTITAALNAHGIAGNTIMVKPGIYHEQVSVFSGVAGNPLVLQATGPGVVVDGSDDYTNTAQWTLLSGNVWRASTVTWDPRQVFLDGARTDSSALAPASLPSRTFRWVSGSGLYINAGGGNPATHQARIGRRNYGFTMPTRSYATIDGFEVTRTEDRGIFLSASCSNITLTHNKVTFANKMGIQAVGGSGILIGSNTVGDCNDHGIALISSTSGGITGSVVEDNESYRNARPGTRIANGIYVFGCPGNTFRRNNLHHNQDTGLDFHGASNNCICYLNRSWNNGDHGYDHVECNGTIHVCDVAYGNYKDGFSLEGNAYNTQVVDCIAVDNGLTTNEFDMWVDLSSTPGLVSDYNIFWNSTVQPPFKYIATLYTKLSDYVAASGVDRKSLQVNPKFVNPALGDFHLQSGSPAIDNANSGVANWPSLDADRLSRYDVSGVSNTGVGPVTYSDRGAYEFRPAGLNSAPSGSIDTPPGNVTISAGQSVNFTGTGFDSDNNLPLTFLWSFGGGAPNSTFEDPGDVVFATAGTYTVTFTVKDALGLADPAPPTRTITVNPVVPGPNPSLSVTPVSGNAPLVVSADASASFAVGSTIVSYRFNFGDGTVVGPQPGPLASHTYAAGNWTASATVTDNLGAARTASVPIVAAAVAGQPNLVGNPSFESSTSGWTSYLGGGIQRVAGGFDGASALLVTGPNNTANFGVDDNPNWVASTSGASARYRFSAWIRSATSVGKVRIRIGEYQGTKLLQTKETTDFRLSPTWQKITFDYLTRQGGTALDFQIYDNPNVKNEDFLVDNVSIVQPDLPPDVPPVARLTVTPSSGFAPLAVTANASTSTDSDGSIVSYKFDFGDGTVVGPQAGATATHAYAGGNWACTVTVTDNAGFAGVTSVPVTVSLDQAPNGVIDSPSSNAILVAGQSLAFTASAFDPDNNLPLTYVWTFGGAAPSQTVEDPGTVVFGTPGTYTVTFTVTDALGLADPTPDTRTITVAANQAPNGVIDTPTGAVTIATGQSVNFTGTGSDPDLNLPLTFLWNFGGGAANQTVEDPGAVVFATPGTYTVSLRVTDALGLADATPDTRVITVTGTAINQAPNGVINTPTGAVTIAAGQSVNFTGTATDPDNNLPLTFLWNFGGGAANKTVEDPGAVVFTAPGTYTVSFTVTDALGLADATPDTRVITVTGTNQAPNGVINTPTAAVTIAAGQSVSFTGTATDPDNNLPLTFLWNFGGGAANRTVEDPGAVVFSTPGTYTVSFTVTDALGLADPTPDTRVVTVTAPDQAPNGVINTPTAAVTITAGQSVSFTGTGTDPDNNLPLTYLWNFGGGAANSTLQNPGNVAFAAAGTYTVSFTVIDALGLPDPTPDTRVITVNASSGGCTNLVSNPSFETDLLGWKGTGCTLAQVAGGEAGSFSCRATGAATLSSFYAEGSPGWIPTVSAGARYHFSAWVRSDLARGIGKIKILEYLNGVNVGSLDSPSVTLSATWQHLQVDYTATQTGSKIYFTIKDTPVQLSEVFDLDDASICPVAAPAASAAADISPEGEVSLAPYLAPTVAPDPLVRQGVLRFSTRRAGPLHVDLYDVTGRRVRTLVGDANASAGLHVLPLDARAASGVRLESGIYFYSIRSADGTALGRFLIMK
jgi:PKD repeat protein